MKTKLRDVCHRMCTFVSRCASDVAIVVNERCEKQQFLQCNFPLAGCKQHDGYNQPPRLPKVSPHFYFLLSRRQTTYVKRTQTKTEGKTLHLISHNCSNQHISRCYEMFFASMRARDENSCRLQSLRQLGAPHVYVLTRWSRNLSVSKWLPLQPNTCKAFELVSITE